MASAPWESQARTRSTLVERFYGSFARSFTLPEDADAEHSKAAFSEGLLTLSLPKMTVKPTHSRDIDIR